MTKTQFERWKDFATRMAKRVYSAHRRPTGAWILEMVENFIDRFDENDIAKIVDWDSSPVYVCDRMSEFTWDRMPAFYWNAYNRAVRAGKDEPEWTDERRQTAEDQWDEQFFGPVRCCVRAGLDVASSPSAGVLGFTIGDLRKMYPEGLPSWLRNGWRDEHGRFVSLERAPDRAGIWL